MTERPILFSAPMVRAILEGRKTQTRRIMKPQPWPDATVEVGLYHPHRIDRHGESQPGPSTFGAVWDHQDIVNGGDAGLRCPYGKPGATLWVRETCWAESTFDGDGVRYAADHVWRIIENTEEASEAWCKLARYGGDAALDNETNTGMRVPSIHMPRWASRITLRITDIRVERLHDIGEEDAKAEGADFVDYKIESCPGLGSYKEGFTRLWRDINGLASLIENPWVWAISFERVKP
jgi:hypothetical protein